VDDRPQALTTVHREVVIVAGLKRVGEVLALEARLDA